MNDKITTSHKAFTLVELLVSITIIGILAQFALLTFEEYRQSARFAHLQVMNHDIEVAVESWIGNDWDNQYLGHVTWLHRANNSNAFEGPGAEFMQFYSVTENNKEYIWYPRLDTRCLIPSLGACSNSITYYVCTMHCDVLTPSGQQRRYCVWKYQNGNVVRGESPVNYSIAQSSYLCP